MELKCNFKAAAKPFEYTQGKFVTKFYVDIDKESKYPQIGEFQFFDDKIKLDTLKEGDPITVHFNINGLKWEKDGKKGFAQNLVAWKLESESKPASESRLPESDPLTVEDDLPL